MLDSWAVHPSALRRILDPNPLSYADQASEVSKLWAEIDERTLQLHFGLCYRSRGGTEAVVVPHWLRQIDPDEIREAASNARRYIGRPEAVLDAPAFVRAFLLWLLVDREAAMQECAKLVEDISQGFAQESDTCLPNLERANNWMSRCESVAQYLLQAISECPPRWQDDVEALASRVATNATVVRQSTLGNAIVHTTMEKHTRLTPITFPPRSHRQDPPE